MATISSPPPSLFPYVVCLLFLVFFPPEDHGEADGGEGDAACFEDVQALQANLDITIDALAKGVATNVERAMGAGLRDLRRMAAAQPDIDEAAGEAPDVTVEVEPEDPDDDGRENLFDACVPAENGGFVLDKSVLDAPAALLAAQSEFRATCAKVFSLSFFLFQQLEKNNKEKSKTKNQKQIKTKIKTKKEY